MIVHQTSTSIAEIYRYTNRSHPFRCDLNSNLPVSRLRHRKGAGLVNLAVVTAISVVTGVFHAILWRFQDKLSTCYAPCYEAIVIHSDASTNIWFSSVNYGIVI